MGGTESKTITNTTINDYLTVVKNEFNNVQKTINEQVNRSIISATQQIVSSSNVTNESITSVIINIDGVDYSQCRDKTMDALINIQNDVTLKTNYIAIQKAYVENKLQDILKNQMKNDFSSNDTLKNSITDSIKNISDVLDKKIQNIGPENVLNTIAGKKVTSDMSLSTMNKIRQNISTILTNDTTVTTKIENAINATFEQSSKTSCDLLQKNNNTFEINIKNSKLPCGKINIANHVVSDIISRCFQTNLISQNFIKELCDDNNIINAITTDSTTTAGTTAIDNIHVKKEDEEKSAFTEMINGLVNSFTDIIKSGIRMYLLIILAVIIAFVIWWEIAVENSEGAVKIIDSASDAAGKAAMMSMMGGYKTVINSTIKLVKNNKGLIFLGFVILCFFINKCNNSKVNDKENKNKNKLIIHIKKNELIN